MNLLYYVPGQVAISLEMKVSMSYQKIGIPGFQMLLIPVIALLISSCGDGSDTIEYEAYNGPIRILNNSVIEHSDSGIIRGKLLTIELFEFESGDRELPKGGYVEFYDKNGDITGSLKSDYGFFTKEKDEWKVEGNVQLQNADSGETLYTEELFWKPSEERVFTDKFVRIETDDQILTGIGLTAKQDFSRYVIKNPQGTFNLDE